MYGDIAGTVFIIFWVQFVYHMLHPYVTIAKMQTDEPQSDLAAYQRNTVVKAEVQLNPQMIIGVKR